MLLLRKLSPVLLLSILSLITLLSANKVFATTYAMPAPGNDIIGESFVVKAGSEDTLLTIGNRYDVGMHEMLESNPNLHIEQEQASDLLPHGTKVLVPTQYVLPPYHKGIVINLAELRLYYFTPDGKRVLTYPVGVGRMEWRTPLASTSVIKKEVDPTWYVPPDIHQFVLEQTGRDLPPEMPPGPENPLGHYAMYLGTAGYLIHGTNQPTTIGKYVSSGCIRMHNEDVEELFHYVSVGTPVHIINYANKAGWYEGRLYLQSRIPLELDAPESDLNPGSLHTVVEQAMQNKKHIHMAGVDWSKAYAVENEHDGIPQQISGGDDQASADFRDVPLPEEAPIPESNHRISTNIFASDNHDDDYGLNADPENDSYDNYSDDNSDKYSDNDSDNYSDSADNSDNYSDNYGSDQ